MPPGPALLPRMDFGARSRFLPVLQRAVGNAAVVAAHRRTHRSARSEGATVQRCGPIPPEVCPCHDGDDAEESVDAHAHGGPVAGNGSLQRQDTPPERKPEDLTGTPFEKLDPTLKSKLADKGIYDWKGKPTLAEALGEMGNSDLAALSRVAAMISSTAPFLWDYVAGIGGSWVTDNFGVGIKWKDNGTLGEKLKASGAFCKDNPVTARYYHGSTNSYRQVPGSPGSPSLHVTIDGSKTDVHIDAHQPIEGKDFFGGCDLDLSAWWDHAGEVVSGKGGARATALGRYGVARGGINDLRAAATDGQKIRLDEANEKMNSIQFTVQKYAAMGGMVGNDFEGDRAMLADKATMGVLEEVEATVAQIRSEQQEAREAEARKYRPKPEFGPKW